MTLTEEVTVEFDMEKEYDPSQIEEKWYNYWLKNNFFHAEPEQEGESFSIVIPPPNVTGSLHIGHALNNTLQDILIRYKRMDGYNTLWMPGVDHAGIATQTVVERELAKNGISRFELGREKFLEKVWEWKKKYGDTIIHQLQRLGASCDWDRTRFTMDEGFSKAVRKAFVALYNEGLIYRGDYIINWCPRCLTALSDLEVEMDEEEGYLYYIRYPLSENKSEFITVATTRPETMLGDTAVAVNPDDPRYKDYIGKTVILPLAEREIPIIGDEYVDPEYGTGALKVTPAHDFNDFEIGKKHNLPLINIFTETAYLNENVPERYRGLERYEARKVIIEDLKNLGLIEKIEPIKHMVGHCYRCKTTVEPFLSSQWFVKTKPLAQPAIESVKTGKTRIIPKMWEKTYFNWMENIRDWCISRQIWWGHRIPVWHCNDCNWEGALEEDPAKCPNCGSTNITQEEDVLDTWFSSGLWPLGTLGWPEETKELQKYYPTSVLITGFDILFFWVARMMMFGLKFRGDVPFKDVYLHALIRDEKGEKMSKTKGNVIDPLEMIDKYGADALRFTLTALAAQGRDIRLSEKRIQGYKAFANKIWNASRFSLMNLQDYSGDDPGDVVKEGNFIDQWIQVKLNETIINIRKNLDNYNFDVAASSVYKFFWYEFCDWYLELTKPVLYGKKGDTEEREHTQKTLLFVLKTVLKLLHPFMPFITEEIWQRLPQKETVSIMQSRFPHQLDVTNFKKSYKDGEFLKSLIYSIRNIRGETHIPAGKKIKVIFKTDKEQFIKENEIYIKQLAQVSEIEFTSENEINKAATTLIEKTKIFVPLEGIIDLDKEITRLNKEIKKLEDELRKVTAKLNNPNFLEKAPQEIVKKEEDRSREMREKLTVLKEHLEKLENIK